MSTEQLSPVDANVQSKPDNWDDQVAHEQLSETASSPEDHAYLEQVQAELDAAHKQAAGDVAKLVMQDGVLVPPEVVEQMRNDGQQVGADTYDGSGRRA